MYLLYSLLLTIGLIILLPRFVIDAFRAGKYVTGLRQRFGNLSHLRDFTGPLIWMHCVSVGETEAARPLVSALRERFPLHRLAISTTTVTGQHHARRAFAKEAVAVFYFPLDWAWTVRRVLTTLQPSAVLIVETELWPSLLRECQRRSIPVALVNGRISETSFWRYRKIRWFMRRVLGNFSVAIMQSEQDASRIRALGMPGDRVLTSGNLKFDGAQISRDDASTALMLRDRFKVGADQLVIVAASTHEPEEAMMLEAFQDLRKLGNNKAVRLIIAPRHPERFDQVAAQISASGLASARRSVIPGSEDAGFEVLLLDSIGELRAAYALADIAFVGGSIAPRGGHNLLEPAAQGVCIVTGPHTNNFAAITKALLEKDAIVQLPEMSRGEAPRVLASTLCELLRDEALRKRLGERAQEVCDENRGATQQTVDVIARLLDEPASAEDPIPFSAFPAPAK